MALFKKKLLVRGPLHGTIRSVDKFHRQVVDVETDIVHLRVMHLHGPDRAKGGRPGDRVRLEYRHMAGAHLWFATVVQG